jgi:pre-rRNA-processing protein RIX1
MSTSSRASSILRLVNSRLRDLSPSGLPLVIPQIARSLVDCKTILSAPPSSSKESADALQLHTFKTQVTTYLNSRAPEEKWAAIILIKAIVELGGLEVLQTSKQWVNGLLSILGKADSPSTKKLCIVLLTRIFLLTHGHQTIVREITTPSLPTFIDACLKLVVPKGASAAAPSDTRTRTQATLLQPVLECFSKLVPNHPTIFRTFTSQLQHLIAPLLAPTPSSSGSDPEDNLLSQPISTAAANTLTANTAITPAAHALYVALHFMRASAKSPADSEYSQQLHAILGAIHATAVLVFRAVVEDWTSTTGVSLAFQSDSYSSTVSSRHIKSPSALNLPGWTGIHAGCERLSGLLCLLRKYLQSRSGSSPVSMPIGALLDALVRISLVTVPRTSSVGQGQGDIMMADFTDTSIRANEQIGREERDALFARLPEIHTAMFGVMDVLLRSIGVAHTSWMRILWQQAVWVVRAESFDTGVRQEGYGVVKSCIDLHGRTLDKDMVNTLSPVLKRACEEISNTNQSVVAQQNGPKTATGTQNGKKGAAPATTLNTDTMFASTANTAPILFQQATSSTKRNCVQEKAFALITTFLLKVPTTSVRAELRSQLDSTIILSNDRDAMLASILNPPSSKVSEKTHSSILPFVARAHNGSAELEGYIRPRMPIVITNYDNDDESDDEEEMEADDGMHVDDDTHSDEQDENSAWEGDIAEAANIPPETSLNPPEPPKQKSTEAAPATLPVSAIPAESESSAKELGVASAQPTLKRSTPPTATESAFVQQPKKARQSPPALPQSSVAPATAAVASSSVPEDATSSSIAVVVPAVVEEDDDDDDFVIPELTMGPDSDDEMEEEDEGDA